MMNFGGLDWRERRNILNHNVTFGSAPYSISNYSTDSHIGKKTDMKFDDTLLSKIHSIPDPLKKNLADSVVHSSEIKGKPVKMSVIDDKYHYPSYPEPENMENSPTDRNNHKGDYYPSLAGITNFFTSFFGTISGAMFTRRPKSPDVQYFDCYDADSSQEMPLPNHWQSSKIDGLNKTLATDGSEVNDDMNNSRAAVAQCETKLNAVRSLLSSESIPKSSNSPNPSRLRFRRPKRVFVQQPGSVQDDFVDEFATEEFVSLANDEYIEYFGVRNNISIENCEVQAAKMKTEIAPAKESLELIKPLPFSDKESGISISENCNSYKNSNNSFQDSVKNIEPTDIVKVLPEILETEVKSEVSKLNDKVISTVETKDAIQAIAKSSKSEVSNSKTNPVSEQETKKEVISSCEDKMAKLKSLLQSRRQSRSHKNPVESSLNQTSTEPSKQKNNLKTESLPNTFISEPIKEIVTRKPPKPVPIQKPKDKKFKNHHRLTDKRKHTKLRKNIQDDMLFAHEIDAGDINNPSHKIHRKHKNSHNSLDASSAENSPISGSLEQATDSPISSVENDCFDETRGCFHSSSVTDSEDSFQIVFAESPKISRFRKASDCDSEDSFIVFEDSPDSCYTTNDVFGISDSESEVSETDSELSDSGCDDVCKLSSNLSRTVSDLTDDSLYEEEQRKEETSDEIDCAVRSFEEIPNAEVKEEAGEEKLPGLLIDDLKKLKRKDQPPKKVRFSEKPPKVRVMRVWAYAARMARPGPWERYVLDRDRFKRRIADVDMAVSWVLKPQHRSRVMFQRFMPWWNAQRRKELAEKKEAEQKRKEEEMRRQEEIVLEEQQQKLLLDEQLQKESGETQQLDQNGDFEGKMQMQETKDTDIVDNRMGNDQQDKNISEEKVQEKPNNKLPEEKNKKAEMSFIDNKQVKEVPSATKGNMSQVKEAMTLKQDIHNVNYGKQMNGKKQVEINKDGIKQNSNETIIVNNKKKFPTENGVKIENKKDAGKLNNFENDNDIIKTHAENQNKNNIIAISD